MNNSEYTGIKEYFGLIAETLDNLKIEDVEKVTDAIIACYQREGTIFFCGNGGSGSTASHFTGDFLKGISYGLEKRFKVICLSDNVSALMAISNDISYNDIFVEPLKNFLDPDDLVIGLSGSGNSENVIKAMLYAKEKGADTVAFCGYQGGKIKDIANISMHVPIRNMEAAEDIHFVILHTIKQEIIKRLKGKTGTMGTKYDNRIQ